MTLRLPFFQHWISQSVISNSPKSQDKRILETDYGERSFFDLRFYDFMYLNHHRYFETTSLFEKGAIRNFIITLPDVSQAIFAPFFLFSVIFLTRKGVTVSLSFARRLY